MRPSERWGRRLILLASLAGLAASCAYLIASHYGGERKPPVADAVAEEPARPEHPARDLRRAGSEARPGAEEPASVALEASTERREARLASLQGAPLVALMAEARAVAERGSSAEQVELVRLLRERAQEPGGARSLREGALDGGPEARLLAVALGGLEGEGALSESRAVLAQSRQAAVRLALLGALPADQATASLFALAYETRKAPQETRFILGEYARRELRPEAGDLLLKVARGEGPARERAYALQLASRRADPRDADGLLAVYLKPQPVPSLRASALVAYAAAAGEAGFDRLTAAFDQERDPQLRGAALTGLSRIGGPRVLEFLKRVAALEPEERLRQRAQGLVEVLSRGASLGGPAPRAAPLPRPPGSG